MADPGRQIETETCGQCHFDASRWTVQDTVTTLPAARAFFDEHLEGLPEALVNERPDGATWSIGEYVDHTRFSLRGMRYIVESALAEPGFRLEHPGPPPVGDPRVIDLDRALAGLERAGGDFGRLLASLDASQRSVHANFNGTPVDVGWLARHACHELMHHLRDVAAGRAALGDAPSPQAGSVARLNVSDGGPRKAAVEEAEVTWRGIVGDRQQNRRHHGRPFQALSLWSAEVIDALRAEGHPVEPGQAGENITVTGVDWARLRPGLRVEIGDARATLTAYATPCTKIAHNFADGDHRRVDHERHPGASRLYAAVDRPATIRPGDPFRAF